MYSLATHSDNLNKIKQAIEAYLLWCGQNEIGKIRFFERQQHWFHGASGIKRAEKLLENLNKILSVKQESVLSKQELVEQQNFLGSELSGQHEQQERPQQKQEEQLNLQQAQEPKKQTKGDEQLLQGPQAQKEQSPEEQKQTFIHELLNAYFASSKTEHSLRTYLDNKLGKDYFVTVKEETSGSKFKAS